MNYPTVQFLEQNKTNLAQYLTYLAKNISCSWYQDRRFLVTNRLVTKEPRAIYFPCLAYPTQFWKELERYTQDDFDFFFPDRVTHLIGPLNSQIPIATTNIEHDWKIKEKEFFETITGFLPKYNLSQINSISVLPTAFGTVGSFYFEKKNEKYNFYHTIRSDFGPSHLAETILSQIFWTLHPLPKLTLWYQTEATVDFLLTTSKIGEVFDYDFAPTVSGLPEISANLISESELYLTKLGFPIKPVLAVDGDYTQTEKRILEFFIQNKNKLVTYDQIGVLFWGDSEEALNKFNLASIAKIMEKIRKKIKDHGIYQELIFTVRGEGYVLYD